MILNQFIYIASQQSLGQNGFVSATRLQSVESAQSQQVAPFFC